MKSISLEGETHGWKGKMYRASKNSSTVVAVRLTEEEYKQFQLDWYGKVIDGSSGERFVNIQWK